MAERFVCNASPLIFLAKIDKLPLLDAYELHVPAQVEAEILKGFKRKKQDAVKSVITCVPGTSCRRKFIC